jgi:non-heme chloroperoxidase
MCFPVSAETSGSRKKNLQPGITGIINMPIRKRATIGSVLKLLILSLIIISCHSEPKNGELKSVSFNGITLHYKIEGNGEALILIHGSVVDLRYWKEQIPVLSKNFQLITYSRRYNYPNENKLEPNHSALVEAGDLLGLMNELKIKKAYILGHSYGGYTALLFALQNPERVKKLILAEPAIMSWLPDLPNGAGRYEKFMNNTWIPIGKAFREQGDPAGLEMTSRRFFHSSLDSVPEIWRNYMLQNVKEWHALAISDNAFPKIDFSKVQNLKIPTLILSGGLDSGNSNDLIDKQLSVLLPNNKRVIIENAEHELFIDNPKATNQAILDFLKN